MLNSSILRRVLLFVVQTMEARSLPTRRFFQRDEPPNLDDHGFLTEDSYSTTLGVQDLFKGGATIVLAPPWTGKSYVWKQLKIHFASTKQLEPRLKPYAKFQHFTSFEEFGLSSELMPVWWDKWLRSGGPACWIIDALDEDIRSKNRHAHYILDQLNGIEKRNSELAVIMFCRESELPASIENRLSEIYSGATLKRAFYLAPMDRKSAQLMLDDDPRHFARVCQVIEINGLRGLGGIPTVLKCLSNWNSQAPVTPGDLWQHVLQDLLDDKSMAIEERSKSPSVDARFRAATRMATVLTFGGCEGISPSTPTPSCPSVGDLFSSTVISNKELHDAALLILKSIAFLFVKFGYRFRQRHVQEWLTAFELREFSLTRVRPLLADAEGKPRSMFRGIVSILAETTKHSEVKEWIKSSFGGLPPRSDASPWTLNHAVATLDRLQEIAKTASDPLFFWRE